ncbi:MAG: metallophosphoesterase [Candidatus Thorarchaeota archaeon]
METILDDKALVLQTEDCTALVITDLHLGYEVDLADRTGAIFPSQHQIMLKRIESLTKKYRVEKIYILGDIKHTITVDSQYNWEVIPEFMNTVSKLGEIKIIPGNHDGDLRALLPRHVKICDVRGIVIENDTDSVGLMHGHAWPSVDLLETKVLVAGHNHPTVRRLKNVSSPKIGRPERYRPADIVPVVLRSNLDKNCVRNHLGTLNLDEEDKGTLVTLPSFNELITGVYVNRPDVGLIGPLFGNECADYLTSKVYSVDGIYLGTIESLQSQFNAAK